MIAKKNQRYIFTAPAKHSTGGPEAIHRLCHKLINGHNIDASIYYLPVRIDDPVHHNYEKLNVPYVNHIEDTENVTLIVSDFYPHMSIVNEYKKINIWIWWLSIDFFYVSYYQDNATKISLIMNRIKHKIKKTTSKIFPNLVSHNDYIADAMKNPLNIDLSTVPAIARAKQNLAQSEYAKVFLGENGIAAKYMPDISDPIFFKLKYDGAKKENIVLYNPSKGLLFSKKIISKAENLKFIPIQNMSRIEMIDIMKRAKVYIDFGSHPGRDRMPREAAMCGCIIITSLRGSAAFNKDICIPEDFKFFDTDSNIPAIIKCIENSIENYDYEINKFQTYRDFIKSDDELVDHYIAEVFK